MKYEYNVEYETNGEKPDLPDDVLVSWINDAHQTGKAKIGCIVWDNGLHKIKEFRIVDERYKPKDYVASGTYVGSIEQFFDNVDRYAKLVGAAKINTPKVYGHWVIGNFYIAVDKQLTPEQIKNTEGLLGWKWEPKGK